MIILATVLAITAPVLHKKAAWPTVNDIEVSLSAKPGQKFPKLLVTKNGTYQVTYTGAKDHGNGKYSFEVELNKWVSPLPKSLPPRH